MFCALVKKMRLAMHLNRELAMSRTAVIRSNAVPFSSGAGYLVLCSTVLVRFLRATESNQTERTAVLWFSVRFLPSTVVRHQGKKVRNRNGLF